MKFIRTTIIGGIVFLVPVTVLIMILGKTLEILSRMAAPLAAWVPVDRVGGVALANLIAVFAIICLCFLAGLVARSMFVLRFINSLESKILYSIPGYRFVKSLVGSASGVEEEGSLLPVLVKFDDASQLVFQVEQMPDGRSVVYVPGAPDPWSGSLLIVDAHRIETIQSPLSEAVKNIRALGVGSANLIGK